MKKPFFLDPELEIVLFAKDAEELIADLKSRGEYTLLQFMQGACRDETWTVEEGGPYLKRLFKELNALYYDGLLDQDQVKKTVEVMQHHYGTLKPLYDEDISFIVDKQEIPASSLMFGGVSVVIADLISQARLKKTKIINLEGIPSDFFDRLKEICYTGKIETLWREEKEDILSLIRWASKWRMAYLEEYASKILQRHIDQDNANEFLRIAQKERLLALKKITYDSISSFNLGVEMHLSNDGNCDLTIDYITDYCTPYIEAVLDDVAILHLKEKAANNPICVEWQSKMKLLRIWDISDTKTVSEELLSSFPQVNEWNLNRCAWLTDDVILQNISEQTPLQTLNLGDNPQLTFRVWGGLSQLSSLIEMVLDRSSDFSDDDLDLLASSCPRLYSISLDGCDAITTQGLLPLTEECPELRVLNISHCSGLRERDFVEVATLLSSLEELVCEDCPALTDENLIPCLQVMWGLKVIHLSRREFSQVVLRDAKQAFPKVRFCF